MKFYHEDSGAFGSSLLDLAADERFRVFCDGFNHLPIHIKGLMILEELENRVKEVAKEHELL